MRERIRRRTSSPALIVAVAALVVALGGAAMAQPSAKKVTTKKVKKIANKEIDKRAPGLSVANADKLGGQAASAFAPSNTLRTALVNTNGTVDAAHSDGVTSANVTAKGSPAAVYCFDGLSPAPRTAVATHAGGAADIVIQIDMVTTGVCAGSQFDVATLTTSNALDPEPFTVFIH